MREAINAEIYMEFDEVPEKTPEKPQISSSTFEEESKMP